MRAAMEPCVIAAQKRISENILRVMEASGLNRYHLAKGAAMDLPSVCRILACKGNYTIRNLVKIADALKVTIGDLAD